jgi:protein O-mannosyl-transferase
MTPRFWKSGVESAVGHAVALGSERRAAYLSLVPAVAAALVAFAWMPAFSAPYQFDDYNTPVGDAASQSLANWWQMLPRTLRPLTKLTFALESSLGADSAPARRVLSALLLGGCVVLLKSLIETLAGLPAALALLVASVWAIHPAQAETVIALAGRPVLLSLFLMLASALLLVRARPGPALGCALLALLARESALPWVVACAALAAHQRGISKRRIAGASVAAFGVGALVIASSTGVRALVESALSSGGAWNRLGLQWAALTRGTFLLFTNPSAFTPDMEFGPSGGARLGLILTTLALYATAAWVALKQPQLRLFALLWLCIVLPTHSIVPKLDVLTARPFSASLAPLLALLACGIAARLARVPWLEAAATLVFAGVFLVLFFLTRSKAELYRDPIALWRDAAKATAHKTRPLVNLGTLLARQGQLHEAESVLTRALERDPTSVDIRLRLTKVRRALRLLQLPVTGR